MTIGALIGWIVFGFIVGLIARFLVPGRQPMGFIWTTLLGVGGSLLGGWVGTMLFGPAPDDATFTPAGWIGSIIGAVALLAIYLMATRDRTSTV